MVPMDRRFVLILLACLTLFVGLVFFLKKDASAPSGGQSDATSNHVQGEGTSGIALVEYGDFQCPACGAYYPIVKQVKEHYGDQITFQFRNFPIVSAHPNAMSAHRAAEAAHMQGKFWEMHDLLYENQESWSSSSNPAAIFRSYAEDLGLDLERYTTDLAREEVADTIQADLQAGKDIGVAATPGFILDGKLIANNPRSLEDFIKLIDEAIADKQNQ